MPINFLPSNKLITSVSKEALKFQVQPKSIATGPDGYERDAANCHGSVKNAI